MQKGSPNIGYIHKFRIIIVILIFTSYNGQCELDSHHGPFIAMAIKELLSLVAEVN